MGECISIVVPTLNAAAQIGPLLDGILSQTQKVDEILVVDSSSDDDTVDVVQDYLNRGVRLKVIQRQEFNHGLTRHAALLETSGEFVIFMTQDAILAADSSIQNLIAPFSNRDIALVTGRQLPRMDARRFEQLVREFNYPSVSNVRDLSSVKTLGIKAYYASDVFSAYRRSAYLSVGGFDATDMSEDMLLAAKLIHAGYRVAYAADATVYHSHSFTPLQQFNRNRAIGAFLERHKDLISIKSEMGEGASLATSVMKKLMLEARFGELFFFCLDCFARFGGNRCGRYSVRRETCDSAEASINNE